MNRVFVSVLADNPTAAAISAHETLLIRLPLGSSPLRKHLMSVIGGGLNGSTQHFILEGKDGVYSDGSAISSRFRPAVLKSAAWLISLLEQVIGTE